MRKAGRRQPTDIVQLKLRLREDVRRRLEYEAARTKRSLNAEMAHRLEMSLRTLDEEQWTNLLSELGPADPTFTGSITVWDENGNQWTMHKDKPRNDAEKPNTNNKRQKK
jgi:hypothetical protein